MRLWKAFEGLSERLVLSKDLLLQFLSCSDACHGLSGNVLGEHALQIVLDRFSTSFAGFRGAGPKNFGLVVVGGWAETVPISLRFAFAMRNTL